MPGRILVLDDEENYAEMLQDLLVENGYRVDMATKPERAIKQLEEIPYDLVISDYKMPVMDGAGFLKKARELYPQLPFILVSGLMNTPELVKVANMGVTLVMEKPLNSGEFLQQVSRFSSPLTDEEREELCFDEKNRSDVINLEQLPSEPKIFSAHNFLASGFLRSLWSAAERLSEVFILEPTGGDAVLGLKDISTWRGYADMPVAELSLGKDLDQGFREVEAILSDVEVSRTICLRLESVSDIPSAWELASRVLKEVAGAGGVLLGYVVSGDENSMQAFRQETGSHGFILPKLCERPSDTAAYARRFARMAADRLGRQRCAEFTPEAALALITYEWPRNYEEIKEVICRAVELSDNRPLTRETLEAALGQPIPSPEEAAFTSLLKSQQSRFLEDYLRENSLGLSDLLRELNLGDSQAALDDLTQIPLFNASGK